MAQQSLLPSRSLLSALKAQLGQLPANRIEKTCRSIRMTAYDSFSGPGQRSPSGQELALLSTYAKVRSGSCVTNAPSEYDGAQLYER